MLQKIFSTLLLCLLFTCSQPDPYIGTFSLFDRESPFLIAAPHGSFDEGTGDIVHEFCKRVRWDCLIAEDFRRDEDPVNVNRPTEGVSLADTDRTQRADLVYQRYMKKLRRLNPDAHLYVEIHGNIFKGSRNRMEISTAGLNYNQGLFLREVMNKSNQATGLEQLEAVTDLTDEIRYLATHNKKFGVMSVLKPALHIELPLHERTKRRLDLVQSLAIGLPAFAAYLTKQKNMSKIKTLE